MIELIGGKLYQWETGRMLLVGGNIASEANAIQFANQGDTVALEIKHDFTRIDGDPEIRIPDKCLQSGKNLLVYLVYTEASDNSDDHSSRILETKIFPVSAKPRPKNYIPVAAEEALGVVRRLTDAAKDAATEAHGFAQEAEASSVIAYQEKLEAEAAKAAAEAAKDGAEAAKADAETAATNAATSAENAYSDYMQAANAQADAEVAKLAAQGFMDEAKKFRNEASAAATKATEEAEKAATSAQNAENYKKEAETASSSAATSAGNANKSAVAAETAKAAAEAAKDGAEAAKIATEQTVGAAITEATEEILNTVDTKLATKASIDDSTIGKDAWSSKNIVDKLCPPIKESGLVVQCEPVEGYPLAVTTENDNFNVTVCGKNLYNKDAYPLATDGYPFGVGTNRGGFSTSASHKRTGFIPVAHLAEQTIVQSHESDAVNPGFAFYTRIPNVKDDDDCRKACCGGTNGASIKVPDGAKYMVFCVKTENATADVQIELGSVSTEYEPYWERKASGNGSAVVVAGKGVNTVFAYDGENAVDITVTGRADPVALIEKLSSTITAMLEG